jgi:two-component system copper resistance phosphate regulon response regulator CusR
MRVLVVEDEAAAASYLRRGLRDFGYAVDIAVSGEEALEKIAAADYDLILLDIGLGHKSGIQVCREIRSRQAKVNILMLTARDGVEDRVLGLDSGADDYLTKPYQFRELLARIRALDRRGPIRHFGVLTVADLSLDVQAHRASRAGRMLDLTRTEFSLLEYLTHRAGHIVSRTEIAKNVWDTPHDPASNTIDVYIQRLRRKIDDEHDVPLIHTKRGLGYMVGVKSDQPNA